VEKLNEHTLPACALISSRGLASLCDVRATPLMSSTGEISPGFIEKHAETLISGSGGSVYVCSDALQNLEQEHLEKIKTPFVLVSGDSDLHLDERFFQQGFAQRLLANPMLERWFAQNLSWLSHQKLKQLPIGLDYHTMWEKPGAWAMTVQTGLAQERQLLEVLSKAPAFQNRHLTCYCNFQFSLDRGDRQSAYDLLSRDACIFELNPIPRLSTWQRQSQCMFVASPQGVGPDCHRTWEAIALGCAPIVKRSTHAELFKDLPVVLIDNWGDISRDFLASKAAELSTKKFNYNKLFMHYWRQQFSRPQEDMDWLPDLSMNEFRFLTTASAY
jgi:hypothetical protein